LKPTASSFLLASARCGRARLADRAKKKAIADSKRKHKNLRPETLETAEYIFVLTTVPKSEVNSAQVLELYRARWQVELAFKRMKSLLAAGHVPKYDDESAQAWIQAKLLTVLLIERLITEARLFSPWGFDLSAS
jgi:IS4 transposase